MENAKFVANLNAEDLLDHLFISYAIEDQFLARWLTLKLTAEGYRVWCDQFKLLGGESYPRDIDHAIKTRTFRFLALLSRASLQKANPRKERTLAANIARERNCEFIVPINVDGLKPTELDWMSSDLTFIPFHNNWAEGLHRLLKKLKSISAPMKLGDGRRVAAETFLPSNVLRRDPEFLLTNWLELRQIPENLYAHRLAERPTREDWQEGPKLRTCYRIDPVTFLSFGPAITLKRVSSKSIGAWRWAICGEILGVRSNDVVSSLLRRSVYSALEQKGLRSDDAGRTLYFPSGLLPDDRLYFQGPSGKRNWIQVVGNRTFRRGTGSVEKCSYHLSLRYTVRQNVLEQFLIEMKVSLCLKDERGSDLKPRSAHSRLRKITKGWFNDGWLSRYLAAFSFATGGQPVWKIGDSDVGCIEILGNPISLQSPVGIDEQALDIDRGAGVEGVEFILDEEDDESSS